MTVPETLGRVAGPGQERPRSRPARVAEFGYFFVSSSAYQASRFVISLIAAATLGPGDFGAWGLIVVILTYATYGNIGILSGANREIPLHVGAGDPGRADAYERAAFGWSTFAGVVMGSLAVLIGVALDPERRALWLALGLALLLQQLYLFYQVSLRSRLDFNAASTQQGLLAVAFPVIALPLLAAWQVAGLVVAQALAYGLGALLAGGVWRQMLRPSLDPLLARALARIGLPIMLSGLAFSAATTVDKWVVLLGAGADALGQYALASTISSSLMFVTLVVAQQFYPRLVIRFGMTGSDRSLRRMAIVQSLVAVAVIAPVSVAILVFGPVIVPMVFPAYEASIGALMVLSVGYLVLSFASGFTNLLITIGRAPTLLGLQVATAIAGTILSVLALRAGLGLTGVAIGTSLSFAGLLCVTVVVAWRATDE